MELLAISNIPPGSKLALPVQHRGRTLLQAGAILTRKRIERCATFGIKEAWIGHPNELFSTAKSGPLQAQTREAAATALKTAMRNATDSQRVAAASVESVVEKILMELLDDGEVLLSLVSLRVLNDDSLNHSVASGCLATVIGAKRGYRSSELKMLATGALLHDIGKSALISRQGEDEPAYSPEFIAREHPRAGFEALRNTYPLLVAHIAYQHHERMDGTGYPRGLSGERIHEYARIAAVANAYDKMVTNASDSVSSGRALYHILHGSTGAFDPEVLRMFRMRIGDFPPGAIVLLDDGRRAMIVKPNPDAPERPVVKTVEDRMLIDLSNHPGIKIRHMLGIPKRLAEHFGYLDNDTRRKRSHTPA